MNTPELNAYREQQQVITDATIAQDAIRRDTFRRLTETITVDGLRALERTDKATFLGLYIAHAKAAHKMIKNLMQAPDSDVCGEIEAENGAGSFTVTKRQLRTPGAGDFVAESLVWNGETIDSDSTRLSLSFLFPYGRYTNSPDIGRTEEITNIELKELTYGALQYKNFADLPAVVDKRETVTEVCKQAGVEVVPVVFNPIVAVNT